MLRQGIRRSSRILAANATPKPPPPSSSSPIPRTMSAASASNPALKPWPRPVIESRGDYRAESHLEDHVGGNLYAKQNSLPRLPVPTVADTMSKFLPTALPLATSDEEGESLVRACEEFEGGRQAEELQRRLVERKEGEMKDSSWLQLWWNTMGYLQVSCNYGDYGDAYDRRFRVNSFKFRVLGGDMGGAHYLRVDVHVTHHVSREINIWKC